MSSWRNVILDNSVQPIWQYSNVSGKSSSGSALIIDTMDLLYQERFDCFCIVSSGSDLTHLVTRLRESEIYVLGIDGQKTPKSFTSVCSKSSHIDLPYRANWSPLPTMTDRAAEMEHNEENPASTGSSGMGICPKSVRKTLIQIWEEDSDDDGWIASDQLSNFLSKQFPDSNVQSFQFEKFVPFVDSMNLFKERTEGLHVSFRLK